MSAQKSEKLKPLGSVVVTGGCGFLGSHIVQQLLSRFSTDGTSVHVLDLRTSRNTFPGASYHSIDISSQPDVSGILQKVQPDVIIHTVSPVFEPNAPAGKELAYKINVQGTRLLVEEAKKVGCKKFLYTSSASVVSDSSTDLVNANEEWEIIRAPAQKEFYSDTKAEAETYVLAQNTRVSPPDSPSLPHFLTCAIRPASMFGERDVQMVPPLLGVIRSKRTGFQVGDNDNLFDFTYVGNVAHAHILAALRLHDASERLDGGKPITEAQTMKGEENNIDGEAFFITNQSPVYFWDFVRSLWNAYDRVSGGIYTTPVPPHKARVLSRGVAMAISYVLAFLVAPILALLGRKAPELQPARVRYLCMTRFYRTRKAEERLAYQALVPLDVGVERTVKYFWAKEQEEGVKKAQ